MKIDKQVSDTLQYGCELVLWIMLPCWVFIVINHESIIRILFGYGRFDSNDIIATGRALNAYGMGLIGYAFAKVLISFYYAVERTSYALKVALFCVAVNFVGNYFLVKQYGYVGLALTSAVTLSFNSLCLLIGLSSHNIMWQTKRIWMGLGMAAIATLIALVLQGLISSFMVFEASPRVHAFASVIANGGTVVLVFVGFAYVFFRKLKFT